MTSILLLRDHVIGRSSGDIGGGRFKDDPPNLVLDRRGLNQFKVSPQFDGPNGKERGPYEVYGQRCTESIWCR